MLAPRCSLLLGLLLAPLLAALGCGDDPSDTTASGGAAGAHGTAGAATAGGAQAGGAAGSGGSAGSGGASGSSGSAGSGGATGSGGQGSANLRIVAANLTSGNQQ